MLKKTVKGMTALLLLAAVTGCSVSSDYYGIAGSAEAAKAKILYSQLDSGRIRVVDNHTGENTEEFTFMYRSDGHLMYSYAVSDGDTIRCEFHNGDEVSYCKDGGDEWEIIDPSSEDYFVYTRTNRHPLTAESVIAVNAYAVADSKLEENGDGLKITFYYNASLLADSLLEIGSLDSFESVLWLDGEGYCYRLDQLAVFDGGETVSDLSMFIDSMNEIDELTPPNIQ